MPESCQSHVRQLQARIHLDENAEKLEMAPVTSWIGADESIARLSIVDYHPWQWPQSPPGSAQLSQSG